jgi:hypothetical protein
MHLKTNNIHVWVFIRLSAAIPCELRKVGTKMSFSIYAEIESFTFSVKTIVINTKSFTKNFVEIF